MKKSKLFVGALAALGMSLYSCSSEEMPGGDDNGRQEGNRYMSFTIKTAGENSSRAAEVGNPEFEDAVGKEGEIAAENLYFLFFDGNGNAFPLAPANVVGTVENSNMVKPTSIQQSATNGSDATVTGVLVLGKAVGEGYVGTTPSQVLCVANPNTAALANLANKNLNTVLATITNAPTKWDATTTFIMTSSTYCEGADNKVITATDVVGKFAKTPDEAVKNPAVLYLERLTAKVRAAYKESFTIQKRNADGSIEENGTFKLDNKDVHFTAEINGWQLRNLASQAKAFKALNPAKYTDWKWDWNDAAKHRSYWAESEQGATLRNTDYDIYAANQFANQTYNAANPTANIQYCYENTGFADTQSTARNSSATAFVVKATIKMADESGKATPINMYKHAGSYYTYDFLADLVKQTYIAGNPNVTKDQITVKFVSNGNNDNKYHAVATINGTDTNMSANYGEIYWWQDGVTSYYLNIEHFGGLTGVVRNHIYDYTFDALVGLGVPGNDPVDPEPDKESFLSAHLNVLNWHVVSNKVVLE